MNVGTQTSSSALLQKTQRRSSSAIERCVACLMQCLCCAALPQLARCLQVVAVRRCNFVNNVKGSLAVAEDGHHVAEQKATLTISDNKFTKSAE